MLRLNKRNILTLRQGAHSVFLVTSYALILDTGGVAPRMEKRTLLAEPDSLREQEGLGLAARGR
jgi:hypothetical protein